MKKSGVLFECNFLKNGEGKEKNWTDHFYIEFYDLQLSLGNFYHKTYRFPENPQKPIFVTFDLEYLKTRT